MKKSKNRKTFVPTAKLKFLIALLASLLTAGFIAAPAAAETVQISSVAELIAFRDRVNNGEASLDAELTADIVWNAAANGQWSPIGKWYTNVTYTGAFDGKGHKISGLYANYPTTNQIALFYGIGADGVVKNLVLDVDFTAAINVAGVAVTNAGTIEYVTVYGSLTSVSVNSPSAGGIVMSSTEGSVISHCVNRANITIESSNVGGIAANFTSATMQYCANYGTITNNYAGTSGAYTGGLAGLFGNFATGTTVVNCFNYCRMSAKDEVPGAVIMGSSIAKSYIKNFSNVYYLKASGGKLFIGGTANGSDGWGAEADNASEPIVKNRIIEKTADEFAGGNLLAFLNAEPENESPAYSYYEADAWKQGRRYPILAEITAVE